MKETYMYRRNKVFAILLATVLVFATVLPGSKASAASGLVTTGVMGIQDYSKCSLSNVVAKQYAENFNTTFPMLRTNGLIDSYQNLYLKTNNAVTKTSVKNASKATFFVYAGHGYNLDDKLGSGTNENGIHFNQSTSGKNHTSFANGCYDSSVLLKTNETRFPHKYVVLYTCNQLTNSGSTTKSNNILKMMNGTRLMMGFASRMYVYAAEAKDFIYEMDAGQTIKNSYVQAAKNWQSKRPDGGTSIVRVVGYKSAINDKVSTYYSDAPSASSNISQFGDLATVTIYHG